MKKVLFREHGRNWCEAEITLDNGRLSVTGAYGRSMSRGAAKKEARRYWHSFFNEDREQLGRMVADFGATSIKSAVDIVLRYDGEFHGLDVHSQRGDTIYLTEGCGCIHETLAKWFPELVDLIPWHLNDMKSNCEHQEARGETYANALSAVCPECGWKLGHGWAKRTLPVEIVRQVEGLAA